MEIMQREVYGYLPDIPYEMKVSEPRFIEKHKDD